MSKPVQKLLASAMALSLVAGLLPASAGIALASEGDQIQGTDELTLMSYAELSTDEADGIIVVMEKGAGEDGLLPISLFGDSAEGQLADAGLEVTGESEGAEGQTLLAVQPAEGQDLGEAVKAAEAVEGVAYAQPNYIFELIEPLTEGSVDDGTSAGNGDASAGQESTSDTEGDADDLPIVIDPIISASGTDDPLAQNTEPSENRASERDQYWLYAADLPEAWKIAKAEGQVTVAVLDSGAMVAHEDLEANILADLAWDAFTQEPLDLSLSNGGDSASNGHGTRVSGIIAAVANNATGIAGASYNANVLPVSVLNESGSPTLLSIINAYEYVCDLVKSGKCDVRVINMSLGGYKESESYTLLKSWIETARDDYGIVTVCAGGNKNESKFLYPSDFDACISVTALSTDGTNWISSDHNQYKDISAPGQFICSTVPYEEEIGFLTDGSGSEDPSQDEVVAPEDPSSDSTEPENPSTDIPGELPEGGAEDGTGEGSDEPADGEAEEEAPDTSYLQKYGYLSGTSLAAPIVSGAIALMFAAVPDATVDEIVEALTATATEIPSFAEESGTAGALNAEAATAYLIENHIKVYDDVDEDDWFYEAVNFVTKNGIMSGYDDNNNFGPEDKLTREMAARLFYNYMGDGAIADATDRVDVEQDEWYSKAVNWAVASGIMTGYDDGSNEFGIGDVLTREQAAKVIATIARADLESSDDTKFKQLVGHEDTSDWALPYMIWAVDMGVLNGTDDTHELLPTKYVSRAEMAKMIMNCIEVGIL